MFTIKQLEAIYWSSSLGSFEAAAEYLNVAQSTISKRISELESHFTDPLFERSGRQSVLTVRGETIRDIAEQMLRLNDRLVSSARGSDVAPMRVRLGVTDLVAISWLPELVGRIGDRYPGIEIEPEIDLSSVLVERLMDRKVDFIICPYSTLLPQFVEAPLDDLALEWMCSPGLIDGRTELTRAELLDLTLLSQSSSSILRPMLHAVIDNEALRFRKRINCNNMGALAEMAATGMGITILPRSFFGRYIQAGRLQVVRTPLPLPKLNYYGTYRNDSYSDFFAAVASICRDIRGFSDEAFTQGLT
ncbi:MULTISPECIES: LysR family transcriptional regulator [unclassified Haematobacter]|uniref:LysR family transcriptional regulator n=1 Tax=unclassified Haematobacter TaxID=2640585 RepID=UPI0025C3AEA6|nr:MULTISPECIES: LysR family transcriptional regulator [unclassified Haematobacter]